jgi:hypothetical protein
MSEDLWDAEDVPYMDEPGDVTVRRPKQGWSRDFYQAMLNQYFMTRSRHPACAKMNLGIVREIDPELGRLPSKWPTPALSKTHPLDTIVLVDKASDCAQNE